MMSSVFKHALLVMGIFSLALVSCKKEPVKPVERFLEVSTPTVELDGKAHVETVGISTNYENINASGGESWCTYSLAADSKSITLKIDKNDGDAARQASISITGVADEGETTRNILVKQSEMSVEYVLDCTGIDFTESNVVDAVCNGKRLAQICKEYIYTSDKSVDRQTAVLYPVSEEDALDLEHGLELSTGATVSWDLSDPAADACTCTGGDGKQVKKLYFFNGSVSTESAGEAADVQRALTPTPSLLEDIRGMEANMYRYVKIGTQYWMAENLKCEKYTNGKMLTESWDSAGSFKYYYDDPEFKPYFGTVYNGYAVLSGNGLAPKGWAIPSMADWNKLYDYLRSKTGTKVKVDEWTSPTESAEYANITGMSIDCAYCWMPYGSDTGWNDEMQKTYFWTTEKVEKSGSTELIYVYLAKSSSKINFSTNIDQSHSLDYGNYVRCFKSLR